MDICDAVSYCQNYGKGCSFCTHYPYPRFNATDKFVSNKCGCQSMLCVRYRDFNACYDCDPFDPPCSLFKYGIFQGCN